MSEHARGPDKESSPSQLSPKVPKGSSAKMMEMSGSPEAQPLSVPSREYYDHGDSENRCFLCERPSYKPLYSPSRFGFALRFMQCQCGIIKQTPMPNQRFFEWFFNSTIFVSARQSGSRHIWGFYDYLNDEPSRLATSRSRVRRLRDVFNKKGRKLSILKIGPSTGSFLYVAGQLGHNAIGCDVSQRFLAFAKENYGVRIDHGRFEDMDYADGQFDVILLFNVIENIPNIAEFLSVVRAKLTPQGYFILNYVDIAKNLIAKLQKDRYFLFRPPVTYIFTKSVMDRTLRKFGFAPVKRLRDVRYMTPEKVLTLLGWYWPYRLARFLRVHRVRIPIHAYPSSILIAQRTCHGTAPSLDHETAPHPRPRGPDDGAARRCAL